MKVDLANKVALITGAAAGIGQAIALAMAENGATVVALDLSGQGEETMQTLSQSGQPHAHSRRQ
jgi:NAD(P)-dependent dehydrogenase (short-subunit alcohol dehydrogenase family)